MLPKKLEIYRVSGTGESSRRITCLAGRVNVFRAQNPNELLLYRDALWGTVQEGRFSVLLGDAAFRQGEHSLISSAPEDSSFCGSGTIDKFLSSQGIHCDESTLLHLGLGGLSATPLSALSFLQRRLLQLLVSFHNPEKVLIADEPFHGLAPPIASKLADLFVQFVWEKGGLAIIPRLASRPQSWIENEYIARIPLERPRKPTIGFGEAASSSESVVAQVRKSMGIEIEQFPPLPSLTRSPANVPHIERPRAGRRKVIWGAALLVALVTLLLASPGIDLSRPGMPLEPQKKNLASSATSDRPAANSISMQPLIESYPEDIQRGIRLILTDPRMVLSRAHSAREPIKKVRKVTASNTESNVAPLSEGLVSTPPYLKAQEARKNRIEQLFLKALARSEENRTSG